MPVWASRRTAPLARVLVAIIAAGAIGCGDKAGSYTPNPAVSEAAVRRALDAWKSGRPAGEVPDSKPAIHVTDAGRKPGQTLESYEVLGETGSESGRTFAVRLHLANPDEEVKAQYVVVGIDPLWVSRKEDFDLLMHWDHHMPPAEPPETDDEPLPRD